MTSLPTVLIFTLPEYGQASVNLATAYELALAGVNVCISSFASLEGRVSSLQEVVARHRGPGDRPRGSVSFRELKGFPSFIEAYIKYNPNPSVYLLPPGVSGAVAHYGTLHVSTAPWDPKEHLAAIESIKGVIMAVKPGVVVIDIVFRVAMDACQLVGQKFVIMFPNSIKDVAMDLQPRLAAFWKYPIISSGFSFPLKWWQIPLNIYLQIRYAFEVRSPARVRQVQALRKSLGVEPKILMEFFPGVPHICPAFPEADFPFAFIPEELVLCGPIIMPFDPLEESDPALIKWLDNRPTVLINLGSHVVSDEKFAREMAGAFRILLDHHERKGAGQMQILWKAKANGDVQKTIDEILGNEIEKGRVKVVAWLDAQPVAILQHPNVVCTVHHGGANSYFEGVWSGVPHVVLPVWSDTYDYGIRAEYLNIGIFGNKTSAPGVRADELGAALVRVTGNTEEGSRIRSAAKQLKEVCRAKGSGRKLASEFILKETGITS